MYTAASQYGVQPQIPGAAAGAAKPTFGLSPGGPDDKGGVAGLVNPRNPLFVFGVLLAATFGLIGVSGSARFGPAKLAADLGKA